MQLTQNANTNIGIPVTVHCLLGEFQKVVKNSLKWLPCRVSVFKPATWPNIKHNLTLRFQLLSREDEGLTKA